MVESVTDRLREEILMSRFAPGERLVELQLAEQFGESRTTIRIALVELEKEGLVVRTTNRGATVRRISVGEAIQIAEARSALEALIAAHAARNATETERDELGVIVGQMQDAVANHEMLVYSECNATLHRRIREMSRHVIASDLVSNLRNRGSNHQFRLALMPGRAEQSLQEHMRIAAAVAAGDEDEASAAMQAHLASVIETLLQFEAFERA